MLVVSVCNTEKLRVPVNKAAFAKVHYQHCHVYHYSSNIPLSIKNINAFSWYYEIKLRVGVYRCLGLINLQHCVFLNCRGVSWLTKKTVL